LVAEQVPEGWKEGEDDDVGGGDEVDDYYNYYGGDEYGGRSSSTRIKPLGEYWKRESRRMRRRQSSDDGDRENGRPKKEIVGYILGKVEDRPPRRLREYPPSRVALYDDDYDDERTLLRYLDGGRGGELNDGRRGGVRFPSPRDREERRRISPPPPPPPTERHGHVTSLAVHSHARRLGIASSLLRQLHYHLRECHSANTVGLHVRISNEAAVRLYCAEGYDVADIMPLYYGDGE
jgi:ribosomal protein S18 acetylase RimI-like enzyme